jgi:hypothetical protein
MNKFKEAVQAAKEAGHELVWDPPANVFAKVGRYTCRKCGKAVLGDWSTAYGAATESGCNG